MLEQFKTLKSKLADVQNLNMASSILGWDQQVFMPPGGSQARAEQLATLDKIAHEKFTTDEIGVLLETLAAADFNADSDEASLIRVAQRDYDKARKLPPDLVVALSRTCSLGQSIWAKAREKNDFSQFQDILSEIIDLNIQKSGSFLVMRTQFMMPSSMNTNPA